MFTMLQYLYFLREKIYLSAIQDVRFQDKSQILLTELKVKNGFSGGGNTSERSRRWTPMGCDGLATPMGCDGLATDENSRIIKEFIPSIEAQLFIAVIQLFRTSLG